MATDEIGMINRKKEIVSGVVEEFSGVIYDL